MADHDDTLRTLAVAVLLAGGLVGAVHLADHTARKARAPEARPAERTTVAALPASDGAVGNAGSAGAVTPTAKWVAAAPGRVEPKGGEIRIGAQALGRVAEILVAAGETVGAGDLLVRLDDADARARVAAAAAEAAARTRERDQEKVDGKAADRRKAEDALARAEREVEARRGEHDRARRAQRESGGSGEALERARRSVEEARKRVEDARDALRRVLASDGLPLPTRLEAGLAAARAELAAAEAALERTRIRAPSAGSVLALAARLGETVAPSPEHVLATLGDLSTLTVRADLEERDVAKVFVGQRAIVRSDAFPGKEHVGRVTALAKALAPGRAAHKGPRKPTDYDVLEVTVELEGETALLAGMRVDVYFAGRSAETRVSARESRD
jgi:HlyD family secretion protein